MYGAIFGDIIGSRFEFDRGGKTKNFKLFTEEDGYTDDTCMTIAVAEGLMKAGKDATVSEIHEKVTESIRKWGHKHPYAGYGGMFYQWLFSGKKPEPYGSYGNGSAMRVSAAGWLYDSIERTREVAKATAEITHNHPEGIKGAECTAAVIFLARKETPKDEIKEYVRKEFGYDLRKSLHELRHMHRHVESCQDSLPKALISFFEGRSFEDVVRNAVSLGGDTDTIGAIAGSMAEAYYGIPVTIMAEGMTYLAKDMLEVLKEFDKTLGRAAADGPEEEYAKNIIIKNAVAEYYKTGDPEDLARILLALTNRMAADGEAPMPMVDVNNVIEETDVNRLCVGDTFRLDQDMRLRMDTMIDADNNAWFPLFTDQEELNKGTTTNICMNVAIRMVLENGLTSERVQGIVINPFGEALRLPKKIIGVVMENAATEGEDD